MAFVFFWATGSGSAWVAKQGISVCMLCSCFQVALCPNLLLGSLKWGYWECIGHRRFDRRDLGLHGKLDLTSCHVKKLGSFYWFCFSYAQTTRPICLYTYLICGWRRRRRRRRETGDDSCLADRICNISTTYSIAYI